MEQSGKQEWFGEHVDFGISNATHGSLKIEGFHNQCHAWSVLIIAAASIASFSPCPVSAPDQLTSLRSLRTRRRVYHSIATPNAW